jgi:hypothetical protein
MKDLEAVAALAAATNAFVNQQNDSMISEANDLSRSDFDAKQFLKKHMNEAGVMPSAPPPAPSPVPQYVENPQDMLPQQVTPQQIIPQQGYVQPVQAHITLPPNVEERLAGIEESLRKLTEEIHKFADLDTKISKFLQRGIDGRVKQITLRLDDSKNKK